MPATSGHITLSIKPSNRPNTSSYVALEGQVTTSFLTKEPFSTKPTRILVPPKSIPIFISDNLYSRKAGREHQRGEFPAFHLSYCAC